MPDRRLILPAADHAAVRAGTKTQHRMVIEQQPQYADHGDGNESDWYLEWCDPRTGCLVWEWQEGEPMPPEMLACCPLGRVGDRLWLPETWARGVKGTIYKADYDVSDGFGSHVVDIHTGESVPLRWRSPQHMPYERCRTVVELTGLRVERNEVGTWEWVAEWKLVEDTH